MLITTIAFSQTNLVVNGDFEQGTIPDYYSQVNRATGWTNEGSFAGFLGVIATPDLFDARSPFPGTGVPSNWRHVNLYDFFAQQGKQRYVFISNHLINGVENESEMITGTLVKKLEEGCYKFNIKAANVNNPSFFTPTTTRGNVLLVTLKSSTNPQLSKDIYNPGQLVAQDAIADNVNWVDRGADFTITQQEANVFDKIVVRLMNLPFQFPNRVNGVLVDEVEIFNKLEVGINIPATIRICKGSELILTPTITYNGLASTLPNFRWTKTAGGSINHYAASQIQVPPYTLRDYPHQNSTYTFTGSDNDCFSGKTVQVIVEDLEPANLIGSLTECDLEDTQQYQLDNYLEGVDVSWVVVGGNLQIPPLNIPTFADVTWLSNHQGPKYIVINQNSWACSRSDTFYIRACCQQDIYEPGNPSPENVFVRAVNTSQSALFNQTVISNSDVEFIEINGTYEIDMSMAVYNNVTFVMGPGAKIVVNQFVEFNDCIFKACGGEMWDGIFSLNYSQINMNNCVVQESLTGLNLRNESLAILAGTLFRKNYVAISARNFGELDPAGGVSVLLSHLQLNNCVFRGNEGGMLLAPYNQVITLAGVNSFRNSHAAIQMHNAKHIRIGDLTNPSNINIFDGLNNGILGRFAQIDVYNAVFSNIQTNELHPQALYPLSNGTAIKYNNLDTPYFNRNDQARVLNCTFTNAQIGVQGHFTDSMRVEGCTFGSVNVGVSFTNSFGRLSIANNNISNAVTGVAVSSTFSTLNIWDLNYLAAIQNNTISARNIAIDVIAMRTHIVKNDIHLIYQNPGTIFTGVRVRNLDNTTADPLIQSLSQIKRNHIQVINGLPSQSDVQSFPNMVRWNSGITIEHCGYLYVTENLIEHTVNALVIEGNTLAKVHIGCNTFQDNYIGIQRRNNSITAQGGYDDPADNRWIRVKGMNARVWEPSNTNNLVLEYFHRGQASGFNAYSPSPFTGLVFIYDNQNSSKDCDFLRSESNDDEGGEQDYFDLSQLEEIAEDELDFSAFGVEDKAYQEYFAQYAVLKAIDADSTLLTNPILSAFYVQNQSGLRVKLREMHTNLLDGDLSNYAALKANVSAPSVFDSLALLVGDIYARSWALQANEPISFTNSDFQTLHQIANMAVAAGGEAVFTARVMLGIDPQPQMALRQQFSDELRFVAESSINVFPNPAQNDVKISGDGMSQLNYRYSITDLQGKLVAKGDVGVLDGYGHIPLNGLNNGVYVLQLINGSEHHQSKLIVLKP